MRKHGKLLMKLEVKALKILNHSLNIKMILLQIKNKLRISLMNTMRLWLKI